jgi:1-acyl-sn-glycerol-3-phosphate acyltransferase
MELNSKITASIRLMVYVFLTLLLIPIQAIALKINRKWAKAIPLYYHRLCLKTLKIKVVKRGRISTKEPTLFVVNHASYIDISILASLIKASFVAKAEIANWPFFGFLAKLQRSIFIDRKSRNVNSHVQMMQSRLEQGDNIVVFPEGASGDGNSVVPFKSSLFKTAEIKPHGKPLTVQPVSIAYARLDGIALGRSLRPYFTWFGNMALVPHIFKAAGLGRLTVIVEFHPVVTIDEFSSRKELSEWCHREVAEGLAEGLAGRPQRPPKMLPA